MSGVFHPEAPAIARRYPVSVETVQFAIIEADGDVELAESIVRVFVMSNVWPEVKRMKENLANDGKNRRADEALASLLPKEGVTVLP